MPAATEIPLEIRPSNMDALADCAGRAQLEREVRRVVPAIEEVLAAEEAELGSDAHEACRRILRAVLFEADGEPRGHGSWRPIYDVMAAMKARFPNIDSWTWACVRRAVDFVLALIVKHEISPENVLLEHRLDGTVVGIERGGTADVVLVIPFKRLLVLDFKFGFLAQDHSEVHGQLGVYAAMAAATFRAEEVVIFLVQPRMIDEVERVTSATFDAAVLRNRSEWSRAVAVRAADPEAELTPTWRACQHCKALPFCPAALEVIMKARDAIEKGIMPTTADAWGILIRAAKIAGRFQEKAEKLAKEHIARGGSATGFEIGPGTVERVLPDPLAVFDALRAKDESLTSAFWKAAKVSRASLDREVGAERTAYEHLLIEVPRAGSLREVKKAAG